MGFAAAGGEKSCMVIFIKIIAQRCHWSVKAFAIAPEWDPSVCNAKSDILEKYYFSLLDIFLRQSHFNPRLILLCFSDERTGSW
jgi:hypothetical protein